MTTEPFTTAALPLPSKPAVDLPAASVQPTPGLDADLAIRTITLLQSLLEKVMGERNGEERPKRAEPRGTYTPRSNAPLSRLATLPVLPTRLRRRSLQFGCPCCGRETVVIRSQAGARIRCPHCQSAVAAPNPRRRRCRRTICESATSRPCSTRGRFAEALKPMAPRWVRLVAKEPVLILALAALVPFTWLLMLEIPGVIDRAKGGVPSNMVASRDPGAVRVNGPADGAAERAVALVERYLAAPSVQAKADWVRDPQRVAPLMASLARQASATAPGKPVTSAEVGGGLSHYQDPSNPVCVTPVAGAPWPTAPAAHSIVEHGESG
jgi:ribosomal protein S27E